MKELQPFETSAITQPTPPHIPEDLNSKQHR